jgi:hypothetical protein
MIMSDAIIMRLTPRWSPACFCSASQITESPHRSLDFTRRTLHVILVNKPVILKHEKPNPTGMVGEAIGLAREQAGLTREQLSKASDVPGHWLGRRERDRSFPNQGCPQIGRKMFPEDKIK